MHLKPSNPTVALAAHVPRGQGLDAHAMAFEQVGPLKPVVQLHKYRPIAGASLFTLVQSPPLVQGVEAQKLTAVWHWEPVYEFGQPH